MAVTKLWSRRADCSHSSGSIVADTIDYACNQDKTKNITYSLIDNDFLEDDETIDNVLRYVVNDKKTTLHAGEFAELEEVLVSGINCQVEKADKEFMQIKEFWNKTDKTLLWHGVQSFEPGEVEPSTAHEIGMKLAKSMWGDEFQVIVTTHCDRHHIHNHFVFNSVSFKDGKKYNYSNSEIFRLRFESDKLCREYGLSVIEHPKGRGMNYYDYINGKGKKTIRALIKDDIDLAIAYSSSLREVFTYLEKQLGYDVNTKGKYTTVHPPGSKRNFRLDNLDGKNPNNPKRYTEEAIVERLLHKERENIKTMVSSKNLSRKNYHTRMKNNCFDYNELVERIFMGTSARAIYWHYYYMLKSIGINKCQYPKTHFKTRIEAQKKIGKYSKHIQFFCRTGLSDVQDLTNYFEIISDKLISLEENRSELRAKLQFIINESDQNQALCQIANLNKEIVQLKKDKTICKEILSNLPDIKERVYEMDDDKNKKQERNDNKWQQKMQL